MISQFFVLFVVFVYGSLLGSFLNVCIYRIPKGSSIVFPPSSCPVCKTKISWWQNIPIFSYLFLLGKCASCGSRISFRYPLIEGLSGILSVFLWERIIGNSSQIPDFHIFLLFFLEVVFVFLLIVITMIDFDYQIIPDELVYFGVAAGVIYSFFIHDLPFSLLAGLGASVFFYAVRVLGEFVFLKEAMGMGDVKFAAFLGVFLGIKKVILAVILSFPIGVALALGLMALSLKSRKDYIPFGPAMAFAAFLSAYWGNQILHWYLHFAVRLLAGVFVHSFADLSQASVWFAHFAARA